MSSAVERREPDANENPYRRRALSAAPQRQGEGRGESVDVGSGRPIVAAVMRGDGGKELHYAPLPKLAYTIPEVTEVTGIGRTSIYEEIAAGRLVARKRGSSTIILAEDLAAYLAGLPVVGKETQQ
jgi:hypothetical protein